MSVNVFLSHAQEDKAVVDRISSYLKEHGLSVWHDSIAPGQDIAAAVDSGIKASDSVLLFLSKNAARSAWASTEAAAAVATNKKIIPILLEQDAKVPSFLQDRMYLDLSAEISEEKLRHLVEATQLPQTDSERKEELSLDDFKAASVIAAEEALRTETENMLRELDSRSARLFKLPAAVAVASTLVSLITAVIALMGGL